LSIDNWSDQIDTIAGAAADTSSAIAAGQRCGQAEHHEAQDNVATGDRQALVKAMLGRIEAARGKPDSRLPGERELASSFGASRASVREVLGVLEALRLIERRPQSGIYLRAGASDASLEALVLSEALDVPAPTAAYEQAQEARVIHEVEAVRLAARRRTAADLAAMHAAIDRSRISLRRGRNLADDDEAFHLALIAAAGNPILSRIAKSLYLMTRSVRRAYFTMPGTPQTSIEEHEHILHSVEKRNTARAVRQMRKHYAGSSARRKRVHKAV
jgi:GntR family transcriptional repressor for pyruvate dehydrogenase complex